MKICMLAAAILFAGVAVAPLPALAQQTAPASRSPAGDWTGDLATPGATYHLGLHIDETAPGAFRGTIGSHETGRWGAPVEQIVLQAGNLSFTAPSSGAAFKGSWDAAANAWVGTYTTRNGAFPIRFAAGTVPPLPTVPGLDGRWAGSTVAQGYTMRIIVRIASGERGTTVLMDLPDQMQTGNVAVNLKREGEKVSFDGVGSGRYAGALSADGATLSGTWSQGGQVSTMNLTRVSTSAAFVPLVRPQVPAKPYPYREEQVAYDNPAAPGVRLACTLTAPAAPGRYPAAIMITGSGPHDRDEAGFGHQPFLVLADALTRRGIAVLRCDDRGVGRSTGNFNTAYPSTIATDVEAGIAYLRTRPDIDAKRIGIIGHSEGGITGPIVASRNPDLAFLVMLAGPGVYGVDLMVEQQAQISRTMGGSEAQIAIQSASTRRLYEAILAAPDAAGAKAAAKTFLIANGQTEQAATAQAESYASPLFREFFGNDPAKTLPLLKLPVLAIGGSRDVQVPAAQNLPAIRRLMAGDKDVTVVELPGLNHFFQTAKTAAPTEYGELEETFAPAALKVVGDWIVAKTGAR